MKKRGFMCLATSLTLTATLVALPTAEALAASWQDGSVSCSRTKPFSFVETKTKGSYRGIKGPGKPHLVMSYGLNPSVYVYGSAPGVNNGGPWRVTSSGNIDTHFTKGFCLIHG